MNCIFTFCKHWKAALKGALNVPFLEERRAYVPLELCMVKFQQRKNQESVFLLDLQQFDPTILYYKGEHEHQHARSRINSSSLKVSHHTVL